MIRNFSVRYSSNKENKLILEPTNPQIYNPLITIKASKTLTLNHQIQRYSLDKTSVTHLQNPIDIYYSAFSKNKCSLDQSLANSSMVTPQHSISISDFQVTEQAKLEKPVNIIQKNFQSGESQSQLPKLIAYQSDAKNRDILGYLGALRNQDVYNQQNAQKWQDCLQEHHIKVEHSSSLDKFQKMKADNELKKQFEKNLVNKRLSFLKNYVNLTKQSRKDAQTAQHEQELLKIKQSKKHSSKLSIGRYSHSHEKLPKVYQITEKEAKAPNPKKRNIVQGRRGIIQNYRKPLKTVKFDMEEIWDEHEKSIQEFEEKEKKKQLQQLHGELKVIITHLQQNLTTLYNESNNKSTLYNKMHTQMKHKAYVIQYFLDKAKRVLKPPPSEQEIFDHFTGLEVQKLLRQKLLQNKFMYQNVISMYGEDNALIKQFLLTDLAALNSWIEELLIIKKNNDLDQIASTVLVEKQKIVKLENERLQKLIQGQKMPEQMSEMKNVDKLTFMNMIKGTDSLNAMIDVEGRYGELNRIGNSHKSYGSLIGKAIENLRSEFHEKY